ncbi:MAG: hypothetical protein B7Y41_03185 [Hydrogenophilales bacterium 28-61-23]|nr:MAG: hypothetical protein B7Y41_03185 [Hydrogenophilales bacterium 28-61-23]
MKSTLLSLLLATGLSAGGAQASFTLFNDQAAFLSATGAASATGALPDLGLVPSFGSASVGQVIFSDPDGQGGFFIGGASYWAGIPNFDWTTRYAGNELAINHIENLNVFFAAPVYSAGFDFVEPGALDVQSPYANDGDYPYVDSVFSVTLKLGASHVSEFSFNAPDNLASFVGVWSDAAFDRMEIRETTGGIEDDYFGQFYTGAVAAPVPEANTYVLMLLGIGLVGFIARRRASAAV